MTNKETKTFESISRYDHKIYQVEVSGGSYDSAWVRTKHIGHCFDSAIEKIPFSWESGFDGSTYLHFRVWSSGEIIWEGEYEFYDSETALYAMNKIREGKEY